MNSSDKNNALCNICSRLEKSVQVLCEGRCLICLRCEKSPAVQKLLESIVFKIDSKDPENRDKDEVKSQCPLCEHQLARSMIQTVRTNCSSVRISPRKFLSDSSSTMFEIENSFGTFLKKYRQTYRDGAEVVVEQQVRPDSTAHNNQGKMSSELDGQCVMCAV